MGMFHPLRSGLRTITGRATRRLRRRSAVGVPATQHPPMNDTRAQLQFLADAVQAPALLAGFANAADDVDGRGHIFVIANELSLFSTAKLKKIFITSKYFL